MAEIERMKATGTPQDIAERCGKFGLPLVLRTAQQRQAAFHAAIAELEMLTADGDTGLSKKNDLEVLLAATFGKNLMRQFHVNGRWSLLHKRNYRPYERDRIIGLAYPWFNYSLYADLFRIAREDGLDVANHRNVVGKYRYFRFFPQDNDRFVLMDGEFEIDIDIEHNLISFGQWSMNHRHDGFEHRGFVFPGREKVDFLTFRGGAMRLGTIHGAMRARMDGIILTSTKGNKRPFAARVLIVKEGQDLFRLRIPTDTLSDGNKVFSTSSTEYKEVLEEFSKINSGTVFDDFGFMWGNKPKPITD